MVINNSKPQPFTCLHDAWCEFQRTRVAVVRGGVDRTHSGRYTSYASDELALLES